MEKPEITVVIPTYNRKERLRGALDSVLSETRVPIRVRVFDNASTDGTADFLKDAARQDNRIDVVRRDQNIGSVRNYMGALHSVGTAFYVPLADDDRLRPDFLFDASTALNENPSAGAAVFFADAMTDAGVRAMTYPHSETETPTGYLTVKEHLREFFRHGHYVWSSILWRKETLDFIGYPYLHTGMPSDLDFQIQIFSEFPVVLNHGIGAVYTEHDQQFSIGYSVRDIPAFEKLIRRMDRAVGPLFDEAEYKEIRRGFFNRYGGLWKRLPTVPVADRHSASLAAIAGVRFDEWELAAQILGEPELQTPGSAESLLKALLREILEGRRTIAQLQSRNKELSETLHDTPETDGPTDFAPPTAPVFSESVAEAPKDRMADRLWRSIVNTVRK